MTGVRARRRAAFEAEILRVGREHLAVAGAAGLSLRAVARDLGVASSAVYRYVDSRDELLTRLIVEAYGSLADQVDEALAAANAASPPPGPATRFRVIARATRTWALAHPHEFALLYGTPVPGYHAPAERTTPPGTRVTTRLTELLPELDLGPGTEQDRRALGEGPGRLPTETGLPPGALRRGLAAWDLVIGTLTAELFGRYGPSVPADAGAYFEGSLDAALAIVGGVRSPSA